MGRLTKLQVKAHEEAMALLAVDRPLLPYEIDTVYEKYNPMADHNVTKGGVFFTPPDLALELAAMGHGWDGCAYVDLCAGIGTLTRAMLLHEGTHPPKRMVCVELNETFVEIGRKLVPEAEWYCADVFDRAMWQALGTFDIAISNPPFGQVMTKTAADWLLPGPMHMQVIEVILRIAQYGEVIMPGSDANYEVVTVNKHWVVDGLHCERKDLELKKRDSQNLARLTARYPGLRLTPEFIDTTDYEWMGAAPKVNIVSVETDDMLVSPPLGV